uniref:ZP domain-containing protein n=1 Tax=Panagrolaimus superbus TaxID=310955 RepID=A0A914Z1I6_9BILA
MKIETAIILLMLFELVSLFHPEVEWSCETFSINLDIKTELQFNGIAHSIGRRSECYVYGKNSTLTNLVISMQPNENNPCGVKINQDTDFYWVEIEVHRHVIFSMLEDCTFNITCKKRKTYFDKNDTKIIGHKKTSVPKMLTTFELLANDHNYLSVIDTLTFVKYGESYFIKVSMENFEYAQRFRVTDCIAESEGLVAELFDSNGCPISEEIKNFDYKNGYATALIPSFFRFFNFKLLKIECKISICDQVLGCQPQCNNLATNLLDNSNQTVLPAQIIFLKLHH